MPSSGVKAPLNLSITYELKVWLTEHKISPSSFFEYCCRFYFGKETSLNIEMMVLEYNKAKASLEELEKAIVQLSGMPIEDATKSFISKIGQDIEARLKNLYSALPNHLKDRLRSGTDKDSYNLRNWLKTRAADFGVFLELTDTIARLRELKDNEEHARTSSEVDQAKSENTGESTAKVRQEIGAVEAAFYRVGDPPEGRPRCDGGGNGSQ